MPTNHVYLGTKQACTRVARGNDDFAIRQRTVTVAAVLALSFLLPLRFAHAQGGQPAQGSTAAPAASTTIKRNSDRSDPLNFLLERKKLLQLDKRLEDSLKTLRKEMRHMQDVVFKDLDKVAAKKENGQPLSPSVVSSLTKDSEDRVREIQEAYRDRAHAMLGERQKAQVDSMEAVWKRDVPKSEGMQPVKRPPPVRS